MLKIQNIKIWCRVFQTGFHSSDRRKEFWILVMRSVSNFVNPLTQNDLYIRHKQCVEVWRNFVHSYSVNWCGSLCFRTHDGQTFIQEPECTPSTSWTPPQTPIYMQTLSSCAFSQLTNMVLTLLALIIVCSGVHCGLKYQHWPMKQTLVVDQRGCQWHTVPI